MKIAPLKDCDYSNYDALAKHCGTIFNHIKWLDMFGEKVKLIGLYSNNDDLIGGFHLYKEKRFGLTFCRNAPLTPHCGPFLKVNAKNTVAIMDNWKKAIALMAEHVDGLNFTVSSISLGNNIIDTQPFIWRKYKVSPRYTYLIDLTLPLDTILKNMSPERRNDIKKGEKSGLSVGKTDDYGLVRSLVAQSFSRQDMAVDNSNMENVLSRFADDSNSFAYVAEDSSSPIAAAFCIHDRETAYYLLGGYAHGNKNRTAGPMVCFEAIKHAQQLGLKTFDFEGSMVPAIESYFRGFGGRLTPCYRVNKAFLPIEIALKFIKRELF